ncbi:MAG: hypothetical protein P0Y55_04915 [Candidatus Cohnella colombiensis]|uniref:Uncharacterized protein n=1 Tax=Candidatus Cohnella colombiensis TaxID=3121368 RepID=A0AA95JDV9_9BACL|nr:MAG: hypothetical protein P0Y55_04915 [Cohnella sp.]
MDILMKQDEWLKLQFMFNERLGIRIPNFTEDWERIGLQDQTALLEEWEMIRGTIPEHVIRFERQIRVKQDQLFEEDDFVASCSLNSDIADLASRINDLHIWFRTVQELDQDGKRHS